MNTIDRTLRIARFVLAAALASSLALETMAQGKEKGEGRLNQLVILAAEPDVDNGELTITGLNFGGAPSFGGTISLFAGGEPNGFFTLDEISFDASNQKLVVALPDFQPPLAGSYFLQVSVGGGANQSDL